MLRIPENKTPPLNEKWGHTGRAIVLSDQVLISIFFVIFQQVAQGSFDEIVKWTFQIISEFFDFFLQIDINACGHILSSHAF